jgi:hypothetical protein
VPRYDALYSAPRTKTYATTVALPTAIKTSIATSTNTATYSGAGLNGSIGAAAFGQAQTVSVTTSAHAGTYTGTAIVVNGKDETGAVISETLTLTQVNGGETIVGTKAFAQVTSVVVPAQFDALGAYTFGVYDVVYSTPPRELRTGGAGTLVLTYQDGSADTITSAVAEHHKVLPTKIGGASTATALTVYY